MNASFSTTNRTSKASSFFPPGYVVRELLGKGSEGEVFLADDTYFARQVTLKKLRPGFFHNDIRTIQATMALTAEVIHPNVARAITAIPDDDGIWVVGAFVEGVDLHDLLEQGPLLEQDILQIALDVAEALDAIANKHIVHGDIKLQNIIISPTGRAHLVDFGLASRAGDRIGGGGTRGYQAPERRKNTPSEFSMDQYSFGALLCRIITGELPQQIESSDGHCISSSIPLEQGESATITELISITNELLANNPLQRPGAATVLHRLQRLAQKLPPPDFEMLVKRVQTLMENNKAERVVDWVEEKSAGNLLVAWARYLIFAGLVLSVGGITLKLLLWPPVPEISKPIMQADIAVELPSDLTITWMQKQVEEAALSHTPYWSFLGEEQLTLQINCSVNICQLMLSHQRRSRGTHLHVSSLDTVLSKNLELWQGAIGDLVASASRY